MLTKRLRPAAINVPTHLIVAGGRKYFFENPLAAVEVFDTENQQWFKSSSLPQTIGVPQMVSCDDRLYICANNSTIFSCSVEDLLKSCKPTSTKSSDGGSVWTRLADVPVNYDYCILTLKERVLAIGGSGDIFNKHPVRDIHGYDVVTNSWSVIGEMPKPGSNILAAVLSRNELVSVVSGKSELGRPCCSTCIANIQP